MEIFIVSIAVAVSELVGGLFVISRKSRDLDHYAFGSFCLFASVWSVTLGLFTSQLVLNEAFLRFVGNSMYLSGLLITSSFYLFASVFPLNKSPKLNKKQIAWLVLPPVIIACLLYFTNTIIKGVYPEKNIAERIEYNLIGNLVYGLVFLINTVWALILFGMKYMRFTGVVKKQIAYLGIGFGLSVFLGTIGDIFLPMFGNMKLIPYSYLFALPYLALSPYAILKYRLLEMDVIIKKTSFYFLIISFTIGIYGVVFVALQRIFQIKLAWNFNVFAIITVLVIVITILQLEDWLESLTEHLSSRRSAAYYKALERFPKKISEVINRKELMEITRKLFMEEMQVRGFGIYLLEKHNNGMIYVLQKDEGIASELPETLESDNPLINYLKTIGEPLETGEFHHKYGHLYSNGSMLDAEKAEIKAILDDDLKAALVVPLVSKNMLYGLLVMGEKQSEDRFTHRDLELLENISNQLSTMFENIRLYEQTIENERMSLIGTIAASLAHEIHNPLTSVKSLVDMLPPRTGNQEFIGKFMEIVPRDIDRVISITKGLEAFALVTLSELTILEIKFTIEQALALLQNKINTAQVEIVTEIADLPQITADGKKISQLFMNLILNACQASKPGNKIVIKAKPIGTGSDPDSIQVEIIDEGEGIKVIEIPNIFKPFYSTRIYGTGLGLPTCKRIVDEHHGEIRVESQEGKGTKVTVILPVNAK
jgi:signal transduction histidine kinase